MSSSSDSSARWRCFAELSDAMKREVAALVDLPDDRGEIARLIA